jgi:hypothetical protein
MFLDVIHRPVFIKHRPVYTSKDSVSEIGFSLRLQVKRTQFCPISEDRDYLCCLGPTEKALVEDGDRIQSPKHCVLKIKRTVF